MSELPGRSDVKLQILWPFVHFCGEVYSSLDTGADIGAG
jgi:hypothetical protein